MEPEVEDMGLELVEATLLNKGGRLILYVAIDKEDGITVDDCGLVSKRLGIILDETDLLKGQYDLEVSSPGINRQLTKKSHFERFSGQRVKIKTKMPINGSRNFTGVFEAKDDGVSVTIDDEKTEILYENIKKANLKIDVKFS